MSYPDWTPPESEMDAHRERIKALPRIKDKKPHIKTAKPGYSENVVVPRTALANVVTYLYAEEEADYYALPQATHHIFEDVRILQDAMEAQ